MPIEYRPTHDYEIVLVNMWIMLAGWLGEPGVYLMTTDNVDFAVVTHRNGVLSPSVLVSLPADAPEEEDGPDCRVEDEGLRVEIRTLMKDVEWLLYGISVLQGVRDSEVLRLEMWRRIKDLLPGYTFIYTRALGEQFERQGTSAASGEDLRRIQEVLANRRH